MRYFWLLCQEAWKIFDVSHHSGLVNMGDYPSKVHFGQIHMHIRPYYLHTPNSPYVLHRESMPSTCQGCAEILGDRYHGKIPLPKIAAYRATEHTVRRLFSHAPRPSKNRIKIDAPSGLAYTVDTRLVTAA